MNKPQKKSEPKVDEAVAESFPASDPPSYMGSSVAGAPKDNAAADKGEVTKPVVTGQISVDLNKATAEELGGLTALSPELVRELIENRPFTSWEEVKELPDFDGHAIAALKKGGAFIGY
jgi:DNA uptake protein ComE-like DNA-binding protein